MLHDIVLALGGIGGDVLKRVLNEEIFLLSVTIHPRESAIMKQLIGIADKYKAVCDFIKKVPFFGSENLILDDGSELVAGMYLRAFCSGLHDSLEPYRHNLVKLEREVLENPYITLTGILVHVSDYVPLLSTMQSLINQIVSRKLHGCQILQLLHVRLSSGVDMVDTAMATILHRCHQVLLKQLTSLLLYGRLIDPCGEFFIQAGQATVETLRTSMTTLDSECPPDLGMDQPEYRIVQDMVPSYIPPSIPEKTKFIGTTVVLFSKDPQTFKSTPSLKMQDSLYDKMEVSLLEKFRELQSNVVLDISQLEQVVENARSCVTQHLFTLAKDQADLLGELKLIKEFYLLGRGELFVSFLQKTIGHLTKAASYRSGRDLSHQLYKAARDVQLNSDLIKEKFSIKVPPKDAVPKSMPVWSVMTLEYCPPWPLHLLFTPSVLASYNVFFNFLFQVKIAELHLHSVWIDHIKKKENPVGQEVWTLRNSLMFLIQNLQCYLQLDVLESEFCTLRAALDKTQDFEQVVHEHSLFLSHVTSQAFLHMPQDHSSDQPPTTKRHPVNKCLIDILRLCDDFCEEVAQAKVNHDNIRRISQELDVNIAVLMNLIALLGSKASGLRLLLLRIDYNRYFSSRTGCDGIKTD